MSRPYCVRWNDEDGDSCESAEFATVTDAIEYAKDVFADEPLATDCEIIKIVARINRGPVEVTIL